MKLIITNPPTGSCKAIDIDDEKKLRIFYDKRMSQEVAADELGDEFKGYIFKITGGNDKQGFPMMQGVLHQGRVRLLLRKGHKGFRPRRDGERKRKSVRGCIAGPDLSVIDLVIVKKGESELPGITDKYIPRRLGPKRATRIRKLFNLSKKDDVRKYVHTYRKERKPRTTKEGKTIKRFKLPKIQRLVTPRRISNKKRMLRERSERRSASRTARQAYLELLRKRLAEARAAAHGKTGVARRASARRESVKKEAKAAKKLAKDASAPVAVKAKAPVKKPAGAKGSPRVGAKAVKGSPKVGAKVGAKASPKASPKVAKAGAKGAAPAKAPAKGAKPAAAPAKPAAAKAPAKPAAKAAAGKKPAAPEKPAAKTAAKTAPAPAKPAAKAAAKKPAAEKPAAAKPAAAKKPAAKKQKQ